jgi:hypothetical protein
MRRERRARKGRERGRGERESQTHLVGSGGLGGQDFLLGHLVVLLVVEVG